MIFPAIIAIFFCSCGVKGKPLPPEKPREIGIGRPQYKGVDNELNQHSQHKTEDEEKKK